MRCTAGKGSRLVLPSVGFRVNIHEVLPRQGCGSLGCSQLPGLSAGYSPAPLAVQAPLGPPEIQQRCRGEQGPQRTRPLGHGPPQSFAMEGWGQEHTYLGSSNPAEAR